MPRTMTLLVVANRIMQPEDVRKAIVGRPRRDAVRVTVPRRRAAPFFRFLLKLWGARQTLRRSGRSA